MTQVTHLPVMTEKSSVLSGSVASSLVGVEHAFFLVPCAALSGVTLTPLVTEEPGLTNERRVLGQD